MYIHTYVHCIYTYVYDVCILYVYDAGIRTAVACRTYPYDIFAYTCKHSYIYICAPCL